MCAAPGTAMVVVANAGASRRELARYCAWREERVLSDQDDARWRKLGKRRERRCVGARRDHLQSYLRNERTEHRAPPSADRGPCARTAPVIDEEMRRCL